MSEDDRNIVIDFFKKANRSKMYKDYPYVAYMQYFEKPKHIGCLMGGLSHFYINSSGHVQPCVFLPVSFGNIMEEDFLDIFKKIREAVPAPLRQPCPAVILCEKKNLNQNDEKQVRYEELRHQRQQMFK